MPTDHKTIRLRLGLRSGKEIVPPNAVVDTTPEIAADLIGRELAEETDAAERYPTVAFLNHVDEAPVTGAEKFPIPPGHEVQIPPGSVVLDVDRKAAMMAGEAGAKVVQTDKDAPPYNPPSTSTPAVNPFAADQAEAAPDATRTPAPGNPTAPANPPAAASDKK